MFDKQLGMRLRELRERRALTQAELAALLGVSRGSVVRWECGTRALPMVRVRDLAQALHVEPAAFADQLLSARR